MSKAVTDSSRKQPWLKNSWVDGLFILSPPFVALLIVALFPAVFKNSSAMPLMYWVVLIVLIDVAHVYSTLYRTYFRPKALVNSPYLIVIPVACYIVGALLYAMDGLLFWRILAYLAVYHFVRQQYGFMRLYSRKEQLLSVKWLDTITIYAATIYPLLYWHLKGDRRFNWFVDGDFVGMKAPWLISAVTIVYLLIVGLYLIKECWLIQRTRQVNIPRNLLVIGTLLSWYFGIVYFNGDMAFTTLNVVSHGIPYMALVWLTERKRFSTDSVSANGLVSRLAFNRYVGVLIFLGLLVLLAFIEEGLWDGLIWREHLSFFSAFKSLPTITGSTALTFLVPLLALPQSTHYVLDGFIWRMRKSGEF